MIAWWILGCAPQVDVDWGDRGDVAATGAVVTTTDFAVGALATVSLDLETRDPIAPTSGDPLVSVDGGFVVQLNGLQYDFVRLYQPGEFSAPYAEFALDRGDNPHAAALLGDALLLTLYERDYLAIVSPSGGALGRIDVSPWGGADGIPEASTLLWVDGAVLVALERFDRATWAPDGGRILAVDPAARAVTAAFEVGPSPVLRPHPAEPGTAMVVTGSFVRTDDWYVPALDGGLDVLDPATGALRPLLRDADLGALVSGYAEGPAGKAALLLDPGDRTWSVACLDLGSGDVEVAFTSDAWLPAVEVDPLGRAWVAERPPGGQGGLRVFDLETCAEVAWVPTLLPPYRLAFY